MVNVLNVIKLMWGGLSLRLANVASKRIPLLK